MNTLPNIGTREHGPFETKVRATVETWLRGDGADRGSEADLKRRLREEAFLKRWHASLLAEQIRQATLTPDTMAAKLGISEHALRKSLADEGCKDTPGEIIQQSRMQLAAERLADTGDDSDINIISADIGFDDPRRFAVVFKAFWGFTPAAYRERLREVASEKRKSTTSSNEHSLNHGTVAAVALPDREVSTE